VNAFRRHRRDARGQGLVEFAFIVPLFMLLLLGMLEFGIMFTHNQALEYATREGARTGAALANGGGTEGCGNNQSPNAALVDQQIIASVERVLTSEGSPVKNNLGSIGTIKIYRADANGNQTGNSNNWTYNKGGGPVVDGKALDYAGPNPASAPFPVCDRMYDRTSGGVTSADSLGVSLTYTYNLQTGLGAILRFFGGNGWTQMQMSDRTVMNINPTNLNITH
jgi:TadE-like protein